MTHTQRPRLPDFLPPAFKGRAACVDSRRGGHAGQLLRACFEDNFERGVTIQHQRAKELCFHLSPNSTFLIKGRGVVAWMEDDSLLLGKLENNTITYYPWPLRKGLHSSPTFLARLMNDTQFTWPDFVHSSQELSDPTLALPCWLPLCTPWENLSLPIWAQNRKTMEATISSLFLYAVKDPEDIHFTPQFHFSFQGNVVNDAGDCVGSSVKGLCKVTRHHAILHKAMTLITETLFENTDPALLISAHLSHDTRAPFINPGTLFSITQTAGSYPTSAHDVINLLHLFPKEVIDVISQGNRTIP